MECLFISSTDCKLGHGVQDRQRKKICWNNKGTSSGLLKQKLGLVVNVLRQVSKSSNNGNTARRFVKSVAEIFGLSKTLIYKFYTLLQILSCGKNIGSYK